MLIILWCVGSAVVLLALWFGPRILHGIKQRQREADTRLPHERYPRILNWRKGDEIQTRTGKYWPRFYAGHATLIGMGLDGSVFLQDYERKWHLSVDDVCECCWNVSASDREISEQIRESKGYTQALSEFNKSVQELQSRDKGNGVDLPEKYYPQVPADLYL